MIDDFVTDNPRHCDGFRQPDNLIIKFFVEIRTQQVWMNRVIYWFIQIYSEAAHFTSWSGRSEWVEVLNFKIPVVSRYSKFNFRFSETSLDWEVNFPDSASK